MKTIRLRLSALFPALFSAVLLAQALPQQALAQSTTPLVSFGSGCATQMGYSASGASIGTPTVIKDGSTACGANARGEDTGTLWNPATLAAQITSIDTATTAEIARQTTITNNDNIANQNAATAVSTASTSLSSANVTTVNNLITSINNTYASAVAYTNNANAVSNSANVAAGAAYNYSVAINNSATNANNVAAAANSTSNYANYVASVSNNTSGAAQNSSNGANNTSNAAQGLNNSANAISGSASNTATTAINTANANNNTTPYLVSVGAAGCDVLRYTFSNGTSGTYNVTFGCNNSGN